MIYDCFLYYDEDMLLDVRLHTLNDVVDRFVIVESTHTFTGKPRRLHFNINKFAEFKEKIIYVVYDESPFVKEGVVDAWRNEASTRNAIMNGLSKADNDDLIIVSDVDEIPDPRAVLQLDKRHLCTTLHMNFYNYQFNLQVFNADGTPRIWSFPRATSFKNLQGFFGGKPEDFRNVKKSLIKSNFIKWNLFKLRNKNMLSAGWHFSWIMRPERISEKMSSISHTEYDLPEFNNSEHIIDALNNGKDIWGRDRKMVKQDLNNATFPVYLVNHREKFREFIL
ncbi:benzoate transporter [Pantoea sp. BIGb0393]|nr:benzoate transporter [Pantoea nemavictus]MBA0038582.1 benzoate transporter [Pantoea nemavictus]